MELGQYKKNDIVTVTIEDIGNDGEGIGRSEGYTLFVKDAVIGDTVEARITKCKKNYGYARVEKVVTPSSFRVEPKCRFHRQCGGCQIQAMSYERQLIYKQNKVRNHLLRIGGFSAKQIDAVTEHPYKKAGSGGMVPRTTSTCVNCGLCAKQCPAHAISSEDVHKTNRKACISCMRCVVQCPHSARKINGAMAAAAAMALKKACSVRKECELFL